MGVDVKLGATGTLTGDELTQLQQKLDELSMQMYTYVGLLQRDAPPLNPVLSAIPNPLMTAQQGQQGAGADIEMDVDNNGEGKVNTNAWSVDTQPLKDHQQALVEHSRTIKEFSLSIATTSKQIAELVNAVEATIEAERGHEEELIENADNESRLIGVDLEVMANKVDDVLREIRTALQQIEFNEQINLS